MTTLPFSYNDANFRMQFPEFSDPTAFPQVTLQMYWNMGNCYVANSNFGRLNGDCRQLALDLMAAHLTQISVIMAGDNYQAVLNIPNNAHIDKITVGLDPPPKPNQWQWWLNTTVYGMQLLALLQANSVGGFYVSGGPPERTAIRKNYGSFGPYPFGNF